MTTTEKGNAMRVPPSPDGTTPTDRTPEPMRDIDLRSRESLTVAASALRGASSLTDDDDTAQWLETLAQQFDDDAANTRPAPERVPATGATVAALDLDAIEADARTADRPSWFTEEDIHDALGSRVACYIAGMDPATALALVAEVRRLIEFRDWWKASSLANAEDVRRLTAICHDWRDRSESAEAEVVTLRAKVAAVEAEKEAILGQVDQAARMLRLTGAIAASQTVIAQVRRWPQFVDTAALATTGEGK